MTEIYYNSFGIFDKFPICNKYNCNISLELQNRFKCKKCLEVFCGEHRIDFNHECPSIKNNIQKISKENSYLKCSKDNCKCKLTAINTFICKLCNKKYCISHRLSFDHICN